MSDLKLKLAFWDYDRTRALANGAVKFDGVNATFRSAHIVSEIFERMIRHREFDVAELGMTCYLRTLDVDDPPFIALPVFPNRCFRHSAIYVNTASGITQHPDLATTIYRGFCAAKDIAIENYRMGLIVQSASIMLPWFSHLIDKDRSLL